MRRFLICLIGLTGLIGVTVSSHSQLLPLDSRGGQTPGLPKSQAWSAPQALRPQTLIDGSTVAVPPGGGAYFLTLTQATTISCPVSLANVVWMTFDLTQGAGGGTTGWQVTWDTCYGFPAFSPPVLTRDTGAVDSVSCYSVPTSYGVMRCGSIQAVGYGFLLRNNHVVAAQCGSPSTCPATIANSVTGDLRLIGIFWGGGASNPVAADITSIQDEHGNVCAEATGAFGAISTGAYATDIYYCQNITGAASSTVTVTFGSSTPLFARPYVVEVAGGATTGADAGIGNHNNGTGTAMSVATTGGMPQPSNFVFSMFKVQNGGGGSGTLTAGANTTLLDQADAGSPDGDAYQIPAASGSVATNAVTNGGSSTWTGSIAAFKHK